MIGRLQDTSAQIRIRIAVLALLALLVLSQELKFDAILGAFMAGALLSALTDAEHDEELGGFRHKLDAIGFGFFIPVFFVATGIAFPLDELFDNSSALLRIPLFLVLLLDRPRPARTAAAQGRVRAAARSSPPGSCRRRRCRSSSSPPRSA